MLYIILLQWILVSSFGGLSFGNYLFGFINGLAISLIALLGYKLLSGTSYLRMLNGLLLMTSSIILIQQNLGRIEMHFHIFIMLSFLLVYKDIKPVIISSLYIILHHLFFTYLQLNNISMFNTDIIVFSYGCGYDIALLHAFFVIFEMSVLYKLVQLNITKSNLALNQKFEMIDLNLELKKSHKESEDYLELISKNIISSRTTLDGTITFASKAFCDVSGYSHEELLGHNHRILRHPDMDTKIYKDLWETIINKGIWEGELKNLAKDGSSYWVFGSNSPIYDENKTMTGYTSIRHDVTNKKHVELISITDGLTQLFNRRHFDITFPKFINSAKRNNDLICFMMLDVDNFKLYNDYYGHQKGDQALISIASTIKDSIKRSDDYSFRLGGEEFGVLFKSETKEKAQKLAELIRKNIEELNIEHLKNDNYMCITISIGLDCNDARNINNVDDVYKNADTLLYEAKKNGRNQVATSN